MVYGARPEIRLGELGSSLGKMRPPTQPLSIEFARVIYAFPSTNMYKVVPAYNMNILGSDKDSGALSYLATSNNGSSTNETGAISVTSYAVGTVVMIARQKSAATTSSLQDSSDVCIILGSVPFNATEMDSPFQAESLFANTISPTFQTSSIIKRFLEAAPNSTMMQDRSYGRPTELLAGDDLVKSDAGPFHMIGKHYAGIGAGQFSRMQFDAVTETGKLFACGMSYQSFSSEQGYYQDLDSTTFFDRRAGRQTEGLGAYGSKNVPFKKDTTEELSPKFLPKKDLQQGIFRHELLEGKLVDGAWETMSLPEVWENEGIKTRDVATKSPFGTMSERKFYDGSYEIRSSKNISLVKSIWTPVPRELLKENENNFKKMPLDSAAPRKNWQDENKIDPEDYPNIAGSVAPYEYDYNNDNWNQQRLRARKDYWKLFQPTDLDKDYPADVTIKESRTQMKPLAETASGYALPPVIEVKNDMNGEMVKYYLSESFFKQLDDGSIVMSDGYGSEIRMAKGNMTISCPGDMTVATGRDMVEMVARHKVINAGKDIYIQSANKSVNIKAETQMQLLSGNSGKGRMLIENRSTEKSDAAAKGLDAGIVIKAVKNSAMIAENMYIGIYDVTDKLDNGMQRTKSGSITIDACAGMFTLLGANGYMKVRDNMVLASADTLGSVISLGNSGIAMLTQTLGISAGNVAFNNASGAPIKDLTENGLITKTLTYNNAKTTISLNGDLMLSGNATATGQVHCNSLKASSVSMQTLGRHHSHGGGTAPGPITIPDINVGIVRSLNNVATRVYKQPMIDLITGANMLYARFYYPNKEDLKLSDDYRLYAARWQFMELRDGSAPVWKEKALTDPVDNKESYIYPAQEFWKNKSILYYSKNSASLFDTYIINCNQEE